MRIFGAALLLLSAPVSLPAQSLLYRPPNLGDVWVPREGILQFNFIHRIYVYPAGTANHKVENHPTFTLAAGLPGSTSIGIRYGTYSLLIPGPLQPNEAELYGRWRGGAIEGGTGLSWAITPAYNTLSKSADGELAADYSAGRVNVTGAVRYATNALNQGRGRAAVAGGLALRFTDHIGIAGDVGAFTDPWAKAAWSVGLNILVPGSPHTLSIEASNVSTSTIEGNSIGGSRVLYGFEFTVPIHL